MQDLNLMFQPFAPEYSPIQNVTFLIFFPISTYNALGEAFFTFVFLCVLSFQSHSPPLQIINKIYLYHTHIKATY